MQPSSSSSSSKPKKSSNPKLKSPSTSKVSRVCATPKSKLVKPANASKDLRESGIATPAATLASSTASQDHSEEPAGLDLSLAPSRGQEEQKNKDEVDTSLTKKFLKWLKKRNNFEDRIKLLGKSKEDTFSIQVIIIDE